MVDSDFGGPGFVLWCDRGHGPGPRYLVDVFFWFWCHVCVDLNVWTGLECCCPKGGDSFFYFGCFWVL